MRTQVEKVYNLEYLRFNKEGQYFDRKSAKKNPFDLLRHFVAFANADGGILVIGIEDDGTITGFNHPNTHNVEEFKNIHHLLRETPIRVSHEEINVTNSAGDNDIVLLIKVEVEQNRVIKLPNDDVVLRQNDKSVTLNFEQRQQLVYDKGQRFFEDEIVEDATLDDIDEELIEQYKDKLGITDIGLEKLLKVRGLLKNQQLTKAGILLFGKNPTEFLPQARIKILKIDGNELGVGTNFNVIKEMTFDDAIPKTIQKTRDFIHTQLRDFQYLDKDGQFQTMPEYPEFAWFEGVVNALTHRNYSIAGDYIKVFIFDNRMEIRSPGVLPNIVTLKNITEEHFSRNPKIARTLSEFGWVRELNEGVKRIYTEMENFFLNKPVYSEPNNNSVLLVLENNILNRQVRTLEKINNELISFEDLSMDAQTIIQYMYNSGEKMTTGKAAKIIGRGTNTARQILKDLTDKNILQWFGNNPNDKYQYYIIKKQRVETSRNE